MTAPVADSLRVRLGSLRRHNLLRAERALAMRRVRRAGTDSPPERPVFVVGCPRSGTSLLYTLLGRHPDFRSTEGEGHLLWNAYQHPRTKGWASDRATAADIRPGEARYLYSVIGRLAGGARFLDKTPKNVLKIPYLAELFPGATFVFLKRNGPDTVGSLIEGWRVRQTPSYRLPQRLELSDYRGRYWCFVLPEGWRELNYTSIADVAALQYASSYDTALADLECVDPEAVVEVVFEDLLARPLAVTERILDRLRLTPSAAVTELASRLDAHPVQSNSPPRPEKWRDRADEIERILPRIRPTMERLGYRSLPGRTG